VSFSETYREGSAIVPQMEVWAKDHKLDLALGWKVELAKKVKAALLRQGETAVSKEFIDRWERLFRALQRQHVPKPVMAS
jgi:hypothetical protein